MSFATFWATALLACAPPAYPLTVVLDMYSGRPNPTQALSNAESQHVMDTIESLREGPCPTPPGLGYRGVVLHDEARRVEIRILDGRVSIESPRRSACVRDTVALEKSLQSRFGFVARDDPSR